MDLKTDTAPIEVLEDLLAARFSCRAFRPDPVPRPTIERILAAAQKTASWCNSQPWRLEIASGQRDQEIPRRDVCALPPAASRTAATFRSRANIAASISNGAAKAASSSTTRSASPEATRPATPSRRWKISISSARRMSPSCIPTRRSGSMARSIAAAMSRASCWRRRRSGVATDTAGGAGVPFRPGAPAFRPWRRPQGGVRHFVRLSRPRAQGQQLPHHARRHRRYRHLRRRIRFRRKGRRRVAKVIAIAAAPAFGFVLVLEGFQQRDRQNALQHLQLQRPGVDDAELQLRNDPVERRLGHNFESAAAVRRPQYDSRFCTKISSRFTGKLRIDNPESIGKTDRMTPLDNSSSTAAVSRAGDDGCSG